ncbi:MAG: sulfotransferase [Pelagibacteraceae bacterium]|nr:sulfotransferase [Pelagibacteraceae bacterium]MCI5079331.1 sulfotransferase [Pelagibacteraceae bacterium]
MNKKKKDELDILVSLLNKNDLDKFYYLTKDYLKDKNNCNPIILNLIGIYFHKIGKFKDAIELFDISISKSKVLAVIVNKCNSLVELKEYDRAIAIYKEIIEEKEDLNIPYIGISNIYIRDRKNKQAIQILQDGLSKIPNDFELNYALATTFFIEKNYSDALKKYLEILPLKTNHPDLHNRIGLCYENLSKLDNAKQSYINALKINANFIDALCNYANLERSLGHMDIAKKTFEKILSINPYIHEVHRYLSIIKKYSDQDPHLKQMLSVIKDQKFKDNEHKLYQIYFALAKAFEDIGNYELSTRYLLKGNNLRRKTTVNHSIDYATKHFETMKRIFEKIDIKNLKGSDDSSPIFILGMPRSGTTLVEQIISNHPEVNSGGEMIFVSQVIKDFFPQIDLDEFEKKVSANIKNNLKPMSDKYLELVKNKNIKKYLTDKLPNNYTFIGFIKLMFPNSKIVHCKRNSKDNCLSIFKNFFSDNGIWFAYDEIELANFYHLYEKYMNFWNSLFDGEIINIQYEDLIKDQEKVTRKLISDLGLNWDENCLTFYKNTAKVDTLSTTQVRQPIYNQSVNIYKNFEKFLPNLFKKLSI